MGSGHLETPAILIAGVFVEKWMCLLPPLGFLNLIVVQIYPNLKDGTTLFLSRKS